MRFSLPEHRTFVAFSLDTVASVQHLDDPELVEACRSLLCKKYVAFVKMVGPISFIIFVIAQN